MYRKILRFWPPREKYEVLKRLFWNLFLIPSGATITLAGEARKWQTIKFPPLRSPNIKLSWKASGTFSCDKFRLPHLINLLLWFGSITIPSLVAHRQWDLAPKIVLK